MKIDWKAVSQSVGYRSLKKAYIKDVVDAAKHKHPMRKKQEFLKLFGWVIARAKHYSVRTGATFESVLEHMEKGRDYWWLNYYQGSRQPKLPSGKPRNVKPANAETYYRKDSKRCKYAPGLLLKKLRTERTRVAKENRKQLGKAARWPASRKKREAEYHLLKAKKNL